MEFLLAIIAVACVAFYFMNQSTANDRKKLWSVYQKAIKSGNKREALLAGRAYYAKKRGGKITLFDEQAISNDLAAME